MDRETPRRERRRRYPAVLLDVGETLVGPAASFGETYATVFRRLGLDLPGSVFERSLRSVWEEMSRRIPAGVDRYSFFPGGEKEYWLRFARASLEKATGAPPDDRLAAGALDGLRSAFSRPGAWEVYSDVVPTLTELRERGFRLAVVSNWDSRLRRLLDTLELSPFFDVIGVSSEEGCEKPDPRFFRQVLGKLGVDAAQAVHVGDVPELDLTGARAAGVDALLIDRRGRWDGKWPSLRSLDELPGIAENGIGEEVAG